MYISYTYGTSKILNNYESLKNLRRNHQQKESTQNLLQNKNENSFREPKVSVFFQHDQTIITKTNHNGFAWHKHKKKHKRHNHNRIMMVWRKQNRKQKAKKNLFIGLPPNKRYRLTPLARH